LLPELNPFCLPVARSSRRASFASTVVRHMKLDHQTLRSLGRLTDRMNLIRKHPLRYEVEPADLQQIAAAAAELERLLGRIKGVPVG
jgi:hypothetical protein